MAKDDSKGKDVDVKSLTSKQYLDQVTITGRIHFRENRDERIVHSTSTQCIPRQTIMTYEMVSA